MLFYDKAISSKMSHLQFPVTYIVQQIESMVDFF